MILTIPQIASIREPEQVEFEDEDEKGSEEERERHHEP